MTGLKFSWPSRCLGVLLAVHVAMLFYAAFKLAPAYDEPAHLVAGISHWQFADTSLYRVNPPLPRLWATAIPYLSGARVDYQPIDIATEYRQEFDVAVRFWEKEGDRARLLLSQARIAASVWSIIAVLLIFWWARELYGKWAGVFSAAMWCFSPQVIGNANLILEDVPACATGLVAAYSFCRWLRSGSMRQSLTLGLCLGVALLTKFTWLILPPVLFLVWLFEGALTRRRASHWRQQFCGWIVVAIVSLFIVNAGYAFSGSFSTFREYQFISNLFTSALPPNAARPPLAARIPIPLPKDFLQGIDAQQYDFEEKPVSYLRGEFRKGGWYYYYIYSLCIKEPLGLLLILGLAACTANRAVQWPSTGVLLGVPFTIFVVVSAKNGFNHHLRYVLPAFGFLFIWSGRLMQPTVLGTKGRCAAVAFLVLAIVPSVIVYPFSYAYFNVLAGGPTNGHWHLNGSNVEWGQGWYAFADWLEAHPGVQLKGATIPDILRVPPSQFSNVPMPPVLSEDELTRISADALLARLEPGWYAIQSTELHTLGRSFDYFLEFEPTHIVGYTIFIYHLRRSDIAALAGRQKQKN